MCGGEVVVPISKFNGVPRQCPVCKKAWKRPNQDRHLIDNIVDALEYSTRDCTDSAVSFFMELDGEDE